MTQADRTLLRVVAIVALIFAVLTALSVAQAVFVPVVIAIVLAMLLNLPVEILHARGLPRWIGAVFLTLLLSTFCALIIATVAEPLQSITREYPQTLQTLRAKIFSLQLSLDDAAQVGKTISDVTNEVSESMRDPDVQEVVVREQNFLVQAASTLAQSMTTVIVTLTIVGFILSIRSPFTTLITMPFGTTCQKLRAARTWRSIEAHVSHYFFMTTLINTGLGITVALALWALEVEMPVFWGIVVGLLNYMPFVGPAIGVSLITAFSIVQSQTLVGMLVPGAVYMAINFVEANFVTPTLIGRKIDISPLAIILALLFWGWTWGFIGLFLSVPILVIANAIADENSSIAMVRRLLRPRRRRPAFGTNVQWFRSIAKGGT